LPECEGNEEAGIFRIEAEGLAGVKQGGGAVPHVGGGLGGGFVCLGGEEGAGEIVEEAGGEGAAFEWVAFLVESEEGAAFGGGEEVDDGVLRG
jgi:hypothetical protein